MIKSLTSPLTMHLNQELDGGPPDHLGWLEVDHAGGDLGDVGVHTFTWNVKSFQLMNKVL